VEVFEVKNVKEYQLKKCIFMEAEEFKKVFVDVFGEYNEDTNEIDVEFDTVEGIYFCGISIEDVYTELSKYFDVDITSIHIDDFDIIGVWICYR
jgi:uncharacterized pyridoxamine 5'-phosphate oxidase family protein